VPKTRANQSASKQLTVGELLRRTRVDNLQKGLREMARLLEITAPHLTDIEKGRRDPSDELLVRIHSLYGIDEATLRSAWRKPEAVIGEIASQSATTAAIVPELLRTARGFTPEQWQSLLDAARRLAKKGAE
jgi:plasmid maintenance system antidote protein VapI